MSTSIFARKSVADIESDVSHGPRLKRTLTKWHLTALGDTADQALERAVAAWTLATGGT